MHRLLSLPFVLVASVIGGGALLAGCGDDPPPAPPPPPVKLTVTAPADGAVVPGSSVVVAGRVTPVAAVVKVLGREVAVSGGTFSETVELDAGGNVIDVIAASPRARPAMVALRIVRRQTVSVPDLIGDSEGDARTELADSGLVADVRNVGGVFDDLLPVEARVCQTTPVSGSIVERGTTVSVDIARSC